MADTIEPDDPVDVVPGVGPARREDLEAEGYATVEDLQQAGVDELAGIVPANVARQIKDRVGDRASNPPSVAEAKSKAQNKPGAKAKGIKRGDGSQEVRVLEKVEDKRVSGAHMTVRKG